MGSLLKAEVKAGVTHDVGARVEDLLESAQRDYERAIGAVSALLEAAKNIQAFHGLVDKDIDEGKYDLEVGAKIKQYVTRSVAVAEVLAKKFSNLQQVSEGRMQGLKAAVTTVKKLHDEAQAQVQEFSRVPASEATLVPASGAEPPRKLSIKQLRLAEEAAVKDAAKAPAPVSAQPKSPVRRKRAKR